jgi:sulfate adenylyltransferase subunit 1
MELIRFFTAGNVDDGKSTLIGRLLYDSQSVSTDIIETLTRQSKTTGTNTEIDLALLTDGLRAEREQGITIDVAYKYFTTEKRKFIIADTPGHLQYTRNMFTGASNADVAIILVDARNGITDQTKRHSIIASILRIPEIVVCINKMDLVNYSESVYREISEAFMQFAQPLKLNRITFIPASALEGDNVVNRSEKLSWYNGSSLLEFLENIPADGGKEPESSRFQVQLVIRPQTSGLHDYRGYAGSILSGHFRVGDPVRVLPTGMETTITAIELNRKQVNEAFRGEAVILHLSDDIDISRGSTLVPQNELPQTEREPEATICWMDNAVFQQGQKFLLQQNSFRTKAIIREIGGEIDIHSFEEQENDGILKLNDFARIRLKTADPVSFDSYADNRKTGAFILINEHTNNTVAAGIFV